MLALLGWQLGHGTALQPWPSTLSINVCIYLIALMSSVKMLDVEGGTSINVASVEHGMRLPLELLP